MKVNLRKLLAKRKKKELFFHVKKNDMLFKVNQIILSGRYNLEDEDEEAKSVNREKFCLGKNTFTVTRTNVTIFVVKNICETLKTCKQWKKTVKEFIEEEILHEKINDFDLKVNNIHMKTELNYSAHHILKTIIPELKKIFQLDKFLNIIQEGGSSGDLVNLQSVIDQNGLLNAYISFSIRVKDIFPNKFATVKFVKSKNDKNSTKVTLIVGTFSSEIRKLIQFFEKEEWNKN